MKVTPHSPAWYDKLAENIQAITIHGSRILPLLCSLGCILVWGQDILNISTPSELRRQGFGDAITHPALGYALKRGYQESWIWSSQLGKGVYARLGFEKIGIGIREYQWKKR